jgi:hypothetical protein
LEKILGTWLAFQTDIGNSLRVKKVELSESGNATTQRALVVINRPFHLEDIRLFLRAETPVRDVRH